MLNDIIEIYIRYVSVIQLYWQFKVQKKISAVSVVLTFLSTNH